MKNNLINAVLKLMKNNEEVFEHNCLLDGQKKANIKFGLTADVQKTFWLSSHAAIQIKKYK